MRRWQAILPLAALGALFAGFGLHHDPHFSPDAPLEHAPRGG